MPSGDRGYRRRGSRISFASAESAKQFEQELKALIDGRRNHPSIGDVGRVQRRLGQFDTAAHRLGEENMIVATGRLRERLARSRRRAMSTTCIAIAPGVRRIRKSIGRPCSANSAVLGFRVDWPQLWQPKKGWG